VVPAGTGVSVAGPAELVLEDGTTVPAKGRIPADLPIGYHEIPLLSGCLILRIS